MNSRVFVNEMCKKIWLVKGDISEKKKESDNETGLKEMRMVTDAANR